MLTAPPPPPPLLISRLNLHPTRLERVIRDLVTTKDWKRVDAVLDQLCNDYAYAVHQPHARNGGLIGLAAAAIALGPVSSHLLAVVSVCSSTDLGAGAC